MSNLPKSKFKENIIENNLQQSDEDLMKASFVKDRFMRMQESRSVVDKDWEVYQKMMEAVYRPYED